MTAPSIETRAASGRTTWTADTVHSTIGFAGRHTMISTVRGTFRQYEVDFSVDESDPTSARIETRIATASLDTGWQQRDGHIRSADFFDVETFPTMNFRSTRTEAKGDRRFLVHGELTIKDTTHPVTLDTTFHGVVPGMDGNRRAAFTARTTVDRRVWGLVWNVPLGGDSLLIGNDIEITIDLTLTQQPQARRRAR